MLTVGSLFSGIGGLELGLERAGMKTIWQAEVDPFGSKVLKKHWPDVPNLGDVYKIDWSQVERPVLVCGGFPCQPVSVAGRGAGASDSRWLWPEFLRCIRALRPQWILIENVPGLLTADKGAAFKEVLEGLASCGYDAEWDCIPAAAVGAPHRRYRVFIVAYPASEGLEGYRRQCGLGESGKEEQAGWGRNDLAYASDTRLPLGGGASLGTKRQAEPELKRCSSLFQRLQDDPRRAADQGWWAVEPSMGRVAHGISDRVDRLKALGNAVVPQAAELVGRLIVEASR